MIVPHPDRLGAYRLVRCIASGGMGVVYEAIDERREGGDARCAVKVVRPELSFVPGSRSRFLREVESVRRLEHPGIVTIRDVGEADGAPFFAMDLIDGAGLGDLLRAVVERLPTDQVLPDAGGMQFWRALGGERAVADVDVPDRLRGSWAEACCFLIREAAVAVDHSHQRGVLHRDLKPNNIMLSRDGRVVVLDFGLARIEGDARVTASRSLLGSLHYSAPEILAAGAARADRRSDVYSLGVSLYELLTGEAPFDGETEGEIRARVLAGRCRRLREFDRGNPATARVDRGARDGDRPAPAVPDGG